MFLISGVVFDARQRRSRRSKSCIEFFFWGEGPFSENKLKQNTFENNKIKKLNSKRGGRLTEWL